MPSPGCGAIQLSKLPHFKLARFDETSSIINFTSSNSTRYAYTIATMRLSIAAALAASASCAAAFKDTSPFVMFSDSKYVLSCLSSTTCYCLPFQSQFAFGDGPVQAGSHREWTIRWENGADWIDYHKTSTPPNFKPHPPSSPPQKHISLPAPRRYTTSSHSRHFSPLNSARMRRI